MTKPAATTAAPAKPTGSAKAPKAKANGTDGGTLSREDINLAKFIKYEDDGGSSDAHSDDGAVNEDGDMDESKRCVHSLYIDAEVSEKTTEERTRGTAPERPASRGTKEVSVRGSLLQKIFHSSPKVLNARD